MADYGEPWRAGNGDDNSSIYAQNDDIGMVAAALWTTGSNERQTDFRRRIIACVNACAGIATEDLEHGSAGPDAERVHASLAPDMTWISHRELHTRAALKALQGAIAFHGPRDYLNDSGIREDVRRAVAYADAFVAALATRKAE